MAEHEAKKSERLTWFGSMPDNWNLSTISSLYDLRNEKVSDKDYPPLSVTMKGIVPQLESAAKTDNGDNRKLVKKHDFAINSRSDRRGSCGISSYDGSVSLINTVLTPREEMHPGYYNWLFHTVAFADEFYKWGHGIVNDLWSTRWQEMKRIVVPLPPLSEQSSIAVYLDDQCAKIDTLIAEAKDSIEEYKQWKASITFETVTKGLNSNIAMKDSGIQWIGETPKHWGIQKIKNLGKARNGLTYSPSDMVGEEGTFVIRSSNIQDGNWDYTDNVYVNTSIPEDLILQNGDIVICSRNGSKRLIGKNAIVENVNDVITFGAFMMVYRTYISNKRYMYWILNSGMFDYYLPLFFSSTINQLTRANFNEMIFPFTTSEIEQKEIVAFLDSKIGKLDSLICEKKNLIDDLELYKKSLIYETVTGKRKVV